MLSSAPAQFYLVLYRRYTPENIDILTEIGVLYLKVNDTKHAFDKLFDVTKINGKHDCSKALIALGAILQVIINQRTQKSHST